MAPAAIPTRPSTVSPTTALILAGLCLAAVAAAETREWRNADGSASFTGELVSQDLDAGEVRIRGADGETFELPIAKLHPEDRAWLAARAAEDAAAKARAELPPEDAVFDTLRFGDDRRRVDAKLRASSMVECTLDSTFFGRAGLNGIYRTRKPIGRLHCELYFDWDDEGGLREITLQTDPAEATSYPTELQATWRDLAGLLDTLHGQPLQAAGYPKRDKLTEGSFLASHLWRLEHGGSALLGTSRQEGKFLVVVRFTTERIKPNGTP